jgi:molybdenum cofactor biosynthesis protein MoaC
MVDVSNKQTTVRTAHASSVVHLPAPVAALFNDAQNDIATPKGPVFATAIIAGTLGVKNTSNLIPFCHPIAIEGCKITINFCAQSNTVKIDCIVKVANKTGVEMEALTGCSIAALTLYDMCKAISHDIVIGETKLVRKTGGKSDIGGSGSDK